MIKLIKKLMPSKEFAIALSGGVDSIALAHFLKQGHKKFTALHVNAKYIPQDDEAEENVRAFCKAHRIPLEVLVVKDVYQKGSVEAWCRDRRYELLYEFCVRKGIKDLVVCHHLDDCVESYLMNCFNGVPEYTPIPLHTAYRMVDIWRPFVLTRKKALASYAESRNLSRYVTEDELNQNIKLQRNWVRHCIRPLIESRYKGIVTVVRKMIEKKLLQITR